MPLVVINCKLAAMPPDSDAHARMRHIIHRRAGVYLLALRARNRSAACRRIPGGPNCRALASLRRRVEDHGSVKYTGHCRLLAKGAAGVERKAQRKRKGRQHVIAATD